MHTHSLSHEVSMRFLHCNVFLEAYISNIHIPSLQVRNQNPFVLAAILVKDDRVNFCSGIRGLRKPMCICKSPKQAISSLIMNMFSGKRWIIAGCSKRYPSASGLKKQTNNKIHIIGFCQRTTSSQVQPSCTATCRKVSTALDSLVLGMQCCSNTYTCCCFNGKLRSIQKTINTCWLSCAQSQTSTSGKWLWMMGFYRVRFQPMFQLHGLISAYRNEYQICLQSARPCIWS